MNTPSFTVLSLSVLIATAALVGLTAAQQGQPSQGGTPSKQPRPANSQPRPISPGGTLPDPTAPATQTPATPPVQPGQAIVQPGQAGSGVVGVIRDGSGTVNSGVDNRYQRPFAFQSPVYESRFTDSSQRLVAMEQRLARSNQELLKRLGDARALSGERQTQATLDILQQLLLDQTAMNQYLVRARTAWSGEIDGSVPYIENDYWNAGMTAPPETSPIGGGNPVR